jgi:general secretion pathway protein B
MSFILEALRKSAHARDRGIAPSVIDRPTLQARRSSLSWWIGGFSLLLLINAGVLLFVLFRPSTSTSLPPKGATAPVDNRVSAVSEPTHRPLTYQPQPHQAVNEAPDSIGPAPKSAERPMTGTTNNGRTPLSNLSPAAVPSVTQLPAQATAGLPPLNLELHVYSTDPSQRFVIINGEHLREGNALKSGPQIEKITAEGVILSFQGARFSLP